MLLYKESSVPYVDHLVGFLETSVSGTIHANDAAAPTMKID